MPGARCYFYATTTTTPQDTYTTSALNVAHPNPVVADANGVFPAIYLDPSLIYKLTLNTSADVLIYTIDPVNDQVLSQAIVGLYLYPQTAAEQSAGVTPTNYAYPTYNVKRYGALGNGIANDYTAIASAILAAAQSSGGGIGAKVFFPTGVYLTGSTIDMPNRVALVGENNRASEIGLHSSFAGSYMFHAANGTSSMFGSRIDDLSIDARGKNMTAVIWTQAWQDNCGMRGSIIQFNGTTPTGIQITDGFGGAHYLRLEDVEIFTDSTAVNDYGIDCQQISSAGSFKLHLVGVTINGAGDSVTHIATNPTSKCVRMVNDTLIVEGLHSEFVTNMISMEGEGSLFVNVMTGSANATVNMIALQSTFNGVVSAHCLIPNGASGLIVDNNVTGGRDINTTDLSVIPSFVWPLTKFSAVCSADKSNITGNGTVYTILFDSERFDEKSEYNPATGIFTAKRTGKYLFTTTVRINLPAGSTSILLNISTTSLDNYVYRGQAEAIRDSSGNFLMNGAVLVEMTALQTARVRLTVNGIGADTVDVLMDDSIFSGQWIER